MRAILALSTCLLLGGCLGGGNSSIPDTFTLSQSTNVVAKQNKSRRQILIAEPAALKTLDSEQVLVRTSTSAVQYLSDAQWNDRLPKIFQAKLAAEFENSGQLAGVGLPGEGLAIDYQIVTSIRAFEIIAARPSTANVVVAVKILNDRNGVVRAQKVFATTVPVSGTGNDDYISSLDFAATDIVGDIVSWSLRYVR